MPLDPSSATAAVRRAQSLDEPGNAPAREHSFVEGIRQGDEAAFEAMFRAYYEPLVRFAARYLGREREAAKDLVHDVLFRVWQQRGQLNVRGSLGTYLRGATRNRCVDYLRRRLTEDRWQLRAASIGDDPDFAGRIRPGADALVEEQEIDAAIARAVARLPPRCRQTFVLQWEGGLTHTEIAAVMGTSPHTVRIQIGRALKALRVALSPFLVLLLTALTQFP